MATNYGRLIKIMLVSEEDKDEGTIIEELEKDGFKVILKRVETESALTLALDEETFDLVICDSQGLSFNPLKVLELLKARLQEIPFLMLFGSMEDVKATEILKVEGDHEYITKGKMGSLSSIIKRELYSAGERLQSRLEIEQAYKQTIEGWGMAVEIRDKGTEGHTKRVTELTLRLARVMRRGREELTDMNRGALLHDIGKIGIPDNVLLKPGPLTDEEWLIMKLHPQHAYNWLRPIHYLKNAIFIPYMHHEKWDGSGYPLGIDRENIPLPARIFALVDTYDALTSDRPYRLAWTKQETLEYIRSESGKSFDPEITNIFLMMMEKNNG